MIAIRAEVYNVYNDISNGQPKLECLNVGCMYIHIQSKFLYLLF